MPYSYTSPSSASSGLDIDRILAQQAQQQRENPSILGLLGNAWEGVTGMVGGVGSLIGAGWHDITQGVGDIADLNPGEAEYRTDDIIKGMLGVEKQGNLLNPIDWHPLADKTLLGSVVDRWSPFWLGGEPASKGWENLYEDPIGGLLDVASVAGLGVGAAAKAGAAAAAAGKFGQAAKLARAGVLDDLIKAGSRTRTAGAAATREVIEQAVKSGAIESAPRYTRLLPKTTKTLVQGKGLVPTTTAYNPLYRPFTSAVRERVMSVPAQKLLDETAAIEADLAKMPNDVNLQASRLMAERVAKEVVGEGVQRVSRPAVASFEAYRRSAKEYARLSASYITRRQAATRRATTTLRRYAAENPKVLDGWAETAQGLTPEIEGMVPEEFATRTGLTGGPVISLGRDAFIRRYHELRKRISEAEQPSPRPDDPVWNLYRAGDWEGFSRARGYSDADIADYREWMAMHGGLSSPGALEKRGVGLVLEDNEYFADPGDLWDAIQRETRKPSETSVLEATPVRTLAPDDPIVQRTTALSARLDEVAAKTDEMADTITEMGGDPIAELDAVVRIKSELNRALLRRADPDTSEQYRLTDEVRLDDLEEQVDGMLYGSHSPLDYLDRAYRPAAEKWGGVDTHLIVEAQGRVEAWLTKRAQVLFNKQEFDMPMDLGDARRIAERELAAGEIPDSIKQAQDVANASPRLSLQELDDAFAAANIPQPIYFPHIDATRLKNSDWFQAKREIGADIMARDPHGKQMRNVLLRRGTWERDPIKVFERRAARAVRERETIGLWNHITKQWGVELPGSNPVAPKGYKLVAPDILFVNHRMRSALGDKIDEYLTEGLDPDTATSRALTETLTRHQDEVDQLIADGTVKFYAVPESVVKNLNAAAGWAPVLGGKNVQLYYDTAMNAWRGLALTASPRWIVNNVLGNLGFTFMQGAKMADAMRILGERYRVVLSNWLKRKQGLQPTSDLRAGSLAAEARRLYTETADPGRGYIGTEMEHYKPHLPGAVEGRPYAKLITRYREGKMGNWFANKAQAVKTLNATIEDAFREASFLTAAERQIGKRRITSAGTLFVKSKNRIDDIMGQGWDETKAQAALRETDEFFGQYGQMTPFERHVIRRYIFPFWGFYRHTTRLMLTFPFEYPARAHLLEGLENVTQDMLEEYGPMPEWMRSPMPIGPPGGITSILSGAGANPFAGPAEGVAGLGQMLSPVIKTALEQATGRNVFTGREFTSRDVFTPYGSDQAYDINTLQPVEKVAPGVLQMFLQQVPQYDMLRDLIAGGPTYDTASVLDAIQQRMGDVGEASPISETGEPYYDVTAADQLAKMFGVNVFEYSLEDFAERQRQDQMAVFNELLRRQSLGAA